MPESRSGQQSSIPTEAPTGWVVVHDPSRAGGFYYRPDVDHPLHPRNDPRWRGDEHRRRLDEDPELQAFIALNRERFNAVFEEFDRHKAELAPDGIADEHTLATLVEGAHILTAKVFGAIHEGSDRYGASDLTSWAKYKYLVEKLVPPTHANDDLHLLTMTADVDVWAANDGTITMAFKGSSANERESWDDLISEAQTFFGHRRNTGGRTPIEKDPEKRAQAIEAVRIFDSPEMATSSKTARYAAIALRLGIAKDGDETSEAVQKRVQRLIKHGRGLIAGGQKPGESKMSD